MGLRWGRILVAAIAVEIAAIVLLVVVVAAVGPKEPEAAAAYAQWLGQWLGPLAGTVGCFLGGWWASRGMTDHHVVQGTMVGVVAAAIDVALLLAGGASFRLLFVASNLARVLAGAVGGWTASIRSSRASAV
jgi:hypothetical protein